MLKGIRGSTLSFANNNIQLEQSWKKNYTIFGEGKEEIIYKT